MKKILGGQRVLEQAGFELIDAQQLLDLVQAGHSLEGATLSGAVITQSVLRGAEDGYGELGFQPAGLIFPGEG